MPSTRFRLLLLLLLGCACLQAAPPSFDARRDYDTYNCVPGQSGVLTIADVNGDGIPDVVCGTVLLGNGDGTFRSGPTLQVEMITELGNLIALDVNRDGKVDLVFPAYENSLLGVGVMLGRGNGSFQNPCLLPLQFDPKIASMPNCSCRRDAVDTCSRNSLPLGMEVHFAPEQEAQLAQIAEHEGTDSTHLVKAAALRLVEEDRGSNGALHDRVSRQG